LDQHDATLNYLQFQRFPGFESSDFGTLGAVVTPVVAQLRLANAIGGWQKSARLTGSWIVRP